MGGRIYCEDCYSDGRRATLAQWKTPTDDLLCTSHVLAAGWKTEDCERVEQGDVPAAAPVETRGTKRKQSVRRQKPQEENQVVETTNNVARACACGCGQQLTDEAWQYGWRYIRGHKPKDAASAPKPEPKAKAKPKGKPEENLAAAAAAGSDGRSSKGMTDPQPVAKVKLEIPVTAVDAIIASRSPEERAEMLADWITKAL
jgi:hypothetical protein